MAVGIEAISSKYALTQAIGTGAMGTVYEATQLSLRRRVAIKVLHPQYTGNAAIIKRFFREALAVSHLRSRYVVRGFDSDVSPAGAPFIVMDRLEGCDLAARLRQGSIETTTVADWTIQVCSAMNEAHRRGIVLKPSNLFLVGDGTMRVLDFGISKFTEAGVLTAGSQILGTPAYIAPEVLRGHQATAQSDLWAIGVIAYKALSDHLPCEAERPDATGIAAMFATLSMPVTPLRHYRPDLPEGLCNAIMKGLVKDPEHRYLSAKDLAIELVPFGSNAEYFEDFTDDELGRLIRDSSAAVPPFADRDGAMARWRDGAMAEGPADDEAATEPATSPAFEVSGDLAARTGPSITTRAFVAGLGAVGVVVFIVTSLWSRPTNSSAAKEASFAQPSVVETAASAVAAPTAASAPTVEAQPSASAAPLAASGSTRPVKRAGKPAPPVAGPRTKPRSPALIE